MPAQEPVWTIESYEDAGGRTPVDDAFGELSVTDRARVQRVIDLLADYGLNLNMPHVSSLGDKLWELRMDGRPNSYRIIYAAVPVRKFLLLHLFAKKSQQTPQREIDTASRRLADYHQQQRTKP
ncbi:MAG: type II toxin-antitoxin system RelE/ParE family toxin [Anaerolineales bacterium]